MEDEWVSYEIHSETPAQGMALADRFPAARLHAMYDRLRAMGDPYGVKFGEPSRLSNSRMALEASEYARDQGKFHAFHKAVFGAYFTDGRDIGDIDVLLDLSRSVDLEPQGLQKALEDGLYTPRLVDAQAEGRRYGVTGTPTFIIDDHYKVVGAQPLDVFRDTLKRIQANEV